MFFAFVMCALPYAVFVVFVGGTMGHGAEGTGTFFSY